MFLSILNSAEESHLWYASHKLHWSSRSQAQIIKKRMIVNKNKSESFENELGNLRRDHQLDPIGSNQIKAHLLALTAIGGLIIGTAGMASGQTLVEKILTELANPLGLVWMLLMLLSYFSFLMRQIWPAMVSLCCWLLLTVAGNSLFSNWLISTLESPYANIDVLKLEKFDSLIVLGGGTSYRAVGRSQFSEGGDRIGLTARLYHAGKTDQIICTGSISFRASASEPEVREQSAELLKGLMVPANKIVLVPGINTSQEIANLKKHFQSTSAKPGRVGVLTSAYHLRRAMRLAKENGLDLIPVPADVKSGPYRLSPNLVIPGTGNLEKTKIAIKEYLAWLLGR